MSSSLVLPARWSLPSARRREGFCLLPWRGSELPISGGIQGGGRTFLHSCSGGGRGQATSFPSWPPTPLLSCPEEDSAIPITVPGRLPVSLAGHPVVAAQAVAVQAAAAQAAVAAQAAALEQLREKLEFGEPPEKKMALAADEQQRLMQRALQQNFLAMTAQLPMSIRINSQGTGPGSQSGPRSHAL